MTSGWRAVRLGDICQVDWGNTNLTKASFIEGGKYLAVSAAGADGRIDKAEHKAFTPVLSAIGANCGRMFLPDEDFTAIKNTITLTPNQDDVIGKFLFHLLEYVSLPIRGAGQPFISKGDIQGFDVRIPPLDEQKRIVAKLDAALRLVGEESLSVSRQVNELASLRTEILRQIFNPKGIGTGEVSLGEVAQRVVVGFVGTTSPHYRESGIPFLRTQNVTRKGLLLEELKFVTPEFHAASKKSQIKEGDVLLSRVITDSVNVGVVPAELGEANCANVVIVTPGKNLIPEYLAAFIGSPSSQQYLLSRKVGSAQVVVNTGTVKEWPVPVPSIAKQKEIVSKLQTIELGIDLVKKTLELKQAQLSDFKKSFLAYAFAGAL